MAEGLAEKLWEAKEAKDVYRVARFGDKLGEHRSWPEVDIRIDCGGFVEVEKRHEGSRKGAYRNRVAGYWGVPNPHVVNNILEQRAFAHRTRKVAHCLLTDDKAQPVVVSALCWLIRPVLRGFVRLEVAKGSGAEE